MRIVLRGFTLIALAAVLTDTALQAQNIPRDEYIRYFPLVHPRLVGGTAATSRLHLFGDTTAPGYVDRAPRDGIDDRRHARLMELAVMFAPNMVMHTTAFPMDFKRFGDDRSSFPLFVDTWDVAGGRNERVGEETIDVLAVASDPCLTFVASGSSDDCRLRRLLEAFHPFNTTDRRGGRRVVDEGPDLFKILFFDFPGEDPASWRAIYEDSYSGGAPRRLRAFAKSYVHPFLHERQGTGGTVGYELVLQFWFFYPFNDGGNDHEGDWEHMNVAVTPRAAVERLLTAEEVRAILDGRGTASDELVMKWIEFYFHHRVMTLRFDRPNVYLRGDAWEAALKRWPEERRGERWMATQTRRLAYLDDEETRVNTHPIGYVGADNKGWDQLIAQPGGWNRDSHGTYPFPGQYKGVGPAGATEQIKRSFDHRKFADAERTAWPTYVMPYDAAERLEILPDWERLVDPVHHEVNTRQDWSWLILPIRWGYPASESPFAGVVAHAETGNLAPPGPAHNGSWSRVAEVSGYGQYDPHRFLALFPLGVEDQLSNQLGVLNFIILPLLTLPPMDLLTRAIIGPAKAAVTGVDPQFYPTENIPFRQVGVGAGVAVHLMSKEFTELHLNRLQVAELDQRFLDAGFDTTFAIIGIDELQFVEDAVSGIFGVSLFLGRRIVSENSLRHSRSKVAFAAIAPRQGTIDAFLVESELNFWEYAGSLRYNLATGGFQPYLKLGYGLSWYRLENSRTATGSSTDPPEPMDASDSPWIRKPSLKGFDNIFPPNTMHGGLGFEWIPLRSVRPPPGGLDLSVRVDYTMFVHRRGSDIGFLDPNLELAVGDAFNPTIWRSSFAFGLTLSF